MAYAVDDFVTRGTIEEVAAALETKLEEYDTTKVIHLIKIARTMGSEWQGHLIIDA